MEILFHRPYITEEEITEVVDSLRAGWLMMGSKTDSEWGQPLTWDKLHSNILYQE